MQTAQLTWTWHGKSVDLALDSAGQGPSVLLLPALSSISTRREMWPLQQQLNSHYRTISIDWPGFGDQPRPALDWKPAAYAAFLEYILDAVAPSPHAIVAAGHAATYALAHACARPGAFERLVLVAPTWRGPLPTMMKGRRPFFNRLCDVVDLPVLGPLLYKLNVNRAVVRFMAAGHVYTDPAWLSGERLREKLAGSRRSLCISPVCDGDARSDRYPRTVSGVGTTGRDPDADGFWERDAATIACGNRRARDYSGYAKRLHSAGEAVTA